MNKQKILLMTLFILLNVGFVAVLNYAQNQTEESPAAAISNGTVKDAGIPRNLFIELFINAGCSSCPKAAFCLEELAWNYEPGRVILVEEHIWGDGYDTPENNSRYDWYVGGGTKGTPDAFFNGLSERVQGLCCDCGDIEENFIGYQKIIDKHLAGTSPIEITAEQSICSNNKTIIQGKIANKSHSLLQNMLLSGMVYHEGDESELFYLVKDIFENQDICQLAPMEERDFSFISDLDLSEFSDDELARLYSVVFVQDRLTKEIIQAFLIQ